MFIVFVSAVHQSELATRIRISRVPPQGTESSVLYSRYSLVIYLYTVSTCTYVNPNSSHPTPSPLGVHSLVLYICLSTTVFQASSSLPFFQFPQACINIYLFFLLAVICITISRSICVSPNDTISFLLMAETYSMVHQFHIFIHASAAGQ